MEITPSNLKSSETYRLLCSLLVPRPIAWVSTLDSEARPNLAPFSFFSAVTSDPPTLMLSVGRRQGEQKDTSKNLLSTGEAVIHIPTRAQAEVMVASSADFESGIDEFSVCGLKALPSSVVKPARVAGAAVAMEVRLAGYQNIGKAPMDVFFLSVVQFHVDDAVYKDGLVDASLLDACGRLGGNEYCSTTEIFMINRPTPEELL